jgi:alkylhydroperoxidase/carboxymuconolactone decarboxylase family protein YurZ
MSEDSPVLDTVAAMTEASVSRTSLNGRELMLVRLGALAAVNAPVASYFLNMGAALDVGLTAEDAQGVLVAVAPIIGAPRTVSAAATVAEALGLAIAIDDAIQDAQASD